ncbi:MAG: haloacid dehalogenase type II [Alphaproteobacteria bacterium]|nr:haloacid dehalogenase type II [Alphaproteobacteria bacterium]
MARYGSDKAEPKALLFDVFGTVVDWRASTIAELKSFGQSRGISADWETFADDWRGLYQPSMQSIRSGERPFVVLDQLHRESLRKLIEKHDLPRPSEGEEDQLVAMWHRLKPWPDVVDGLYRLKRRYIIGTLSNGNIGMMVRLAKHSGLPWDVITGAEVAGDYKPKPDVYRKSARALNLDEAECMLVAAHNDDLSAASAVGFQTAFVARPGEYGPHQTKDRHATSAWDIVTDSFGGLADLLNCPRY